MLSAFDISGVQALFGPWIISASLVLTRISGFFVTTPGYSANMIPVPIKLGMVGTISIVVVMTIQPVSDLKDLTALGLVGAGITELLVGTLMGFAVKILFGALAFTGQLIGVQMGFAIANVVDPSTRENNGLLAQVLNLLGLMLFFALDGHLMMLRALLESFQIVPLGGIEPQTRLILSKLILLGSDIFYIGLRIGLPVVCVVLLVNVGLAAISRTVPQINVFVIGFLFTISLGTLVLGLSMPSTAMIFERYLAESLANAMGLLRLL